MNSFLKGAAAGLLVGSAVVMMTIPMTKQSPKKRVSRALKSMGDLVDDIGDVFRG